MHSNQSIYWTFEWPMRGKVTSVWCLPLLLGSLSFEPTDPRSTLNFYAAGSQPVTVPHFCDWLPVDLCIWKLIEASKWVRAGKRSLSFVSQRELEVGALSGRCLLLVLPSTSPVRRVHDKETRSRNLAGSHFSVRMHSNVSMWSVFKKFVSLCTGSGLDFRLIREYLVYQWITCTNTLK